MRLGGFNTVIQCHYWHNSKFSVTSVSARNDLNISFYVYARDFYKFYVYSRGTILAKKNILMIVSGTTSGRNFRQLLFNVRYLGNYVLYEEITKKS